MKLTGFLCIGISLLLMQTLVAANDLAEHLQNVSVTINSNRGTGSGTLITREVKVSGESDTTEQVTFVLTAAHVVDGLRSVRTVIDPKSGTEVKLVEFADASLVKELSEGGRKVGETTMLAKVIKYSDADNGEDIAILMVRKRNFVNVSAEFFLGGDIVPVGTALFHVGSLKGQLGANSMTHGIMSQVGRVLPIGSRENVIFDQTTATAFPGSSGGGLFLADNDNAGKYVGMLVRGGGETFNFIVPIRRIKEWANRVELMWLLDPSLPVPTLQEIEQIKAEDVGVLNFGRGSSEEKKEYPFLLYHPKDQTECQGQNTGKNIEIINTLKTE